MKALPKVLIIIALAAAIAGVVALKERADHGEAEVASEAPETQAGEAQTPDSGQDKPTALPRLVDLGSDKCVPCKAMEPILEELKKEYAGTFDVEFIDVRKDPEAGRAFGVQMIPTQVFLDASGEERFRHTGFFSKEDILAKWRELGVG